MDCLSFSPVDISYANFKYKNNRYKHLKVIPFKRLGPLGNYVMNIAKMQ